MSDHRESATSVLEPLPDPPDTAPGSPDASPGERRHKRWVFALLLLLAFGLGVGVVVGLAGGSDEAEPAVAPPRAAASRERATAPAPPSDAPASPAAAAPDGRTAVERFLAGEVDRDFEKSYGVLAASDRARYRTAGDWSAEHAQLPLLTGFEIADVEEGDRRVVVDARVDLQAGLDPFIGLVTPTADSQWVAVAEDGGWRVDYAASRLEPIYPSDDGLVDDVRAWLDVKTSCREAKQYEGGLITGDEVASELCGATDLVVGAVEPLAVDDAQPYVDAFGSNTTEWARTARVDGPLPLRVVTGPVGDRWVVLGLLADGPGAER